VSCVGESASAASSPWLVRDLTSFASRVSSFGPGVGGGLKGLDLGFEVSRSVLPRSARDDRLKIGSSRFQRETWGWGIGQGGWTEVLWFRRIQLGRSRGPRRSPR